MKYEIKDVAVLRKLLWLDTILGSSTAIVGIVFYIPLTTWLGLTPTFILSVSIITLLYAIVAFLLANQRSISISLLRVLISGNWLWSAVSTGLLLLHFTEATVLGKIFLVLQVIVVGGLAYLEGSQLVNKYRLV